MKKIMKYYQRCIAFVVIAILAISVQADTVSTAVHTLTGHTGAIYSVDYSPDGLRILTAGEDNTIKLWDSSTGALLRTFEGHTDYVSSVTFNHDGQRVLSGSGDGTMRLWDVNTGAELRSFTGHIGVVTSVAFSPDGQTALSGHEDWTMNVWNVDTGEEIKTFNAYTGWAVFVAFSPDGQRVLSAGQDGQMTVWDVNTESLVQTFVGHKGYVNSVAFSPDGQRIVSGGTYNDGYEWNADMYLWDVNTGQIIKTFVGHTIGVTSVAYSYDGKKVLSGGDDNTVKLWDVSTEEVLRTFTGHTASVTEVDFSPDRQRILSGSADMTAKVWDISYTLTVNMVGEGIVIGNNTYYFTDTQVNLTAIPDSGWTFSGWSGDCDANGQVLVNTNKTCIVTFAQSSADIFSIIGDINETLSTLANLINELKENNTVIIKSAEGDRFYSFNPDEIEQVDSSEQGMSLTQGGHPIITTPAGKRIIFYPTPKKDKLIESVNKTDIADIGDSTITDTSTELCTDEVEYGNRSDTLMGFCQEDSVIRRTISRYIHKVTTFNSLIEPNAEQICTRSAIGQDICQQVGVHIIQRSRSRSSIAREMGYVVYSDGTAQEFYPTILSPEIFIAQVKEIAGVEDIYLNIDGSFTAIYLGQTIAIQPTFDVVSEELGEGEPAVEPSMRINTNNSISYVIQHGNEILTSTLLFAIMPPEVPAIETFITQAKAFPNVSDVVYDSENRVFNVVYSGQSFTLVPTYDIQRLALAEGITVTPSITVNADGHSVNYITQEGMQQITMRMLIQ